MTKTSTATHIDKVVTAIIRDYLDAHGTVAEPRKYIGIARESMSAECQHLLMLTGVVVVVWGKFSTDTSTRSVRFARYCYAGEL